MDAAVRTVAVRRGSQRHRHRTHTLEPCAHPRRQSVRKIVINVPLEDRLNPSPSGEVKVRDAGPSMGLRINSRRHPGAFSVQVQKPPGFRLESILGPRRAGMTGTRVDVQSTNSEPLSLEPRVAQFYLSPEFFDFFSAHANHLTNLSAVRLTR